MDIQAVIIARKYAQAFLNLYMDSITPAMYTQLIDMQTFLDKHRDALIYFRLPHIAVEAKIRLLDELGEKFKPSEPVKKLFEILIRHNRAQLLPVVLSKICECYRRRKNIVLFDIESSHELDRQAMVTLENFLAHNTGKNIMSKQHINRDLIAGIRLKSTTFLWEYSIRKQMNELSKIVKTKGYQ
jgi:ATP synthase F1 delta subunit